MPDEPTYRIVPLNIHDFPPPGDDWGLFTCAGCNARMGDLFQHGVCMLCPDCCTCPQHENE